MQRHEIFFSKSTELNYLIQNLQNFHNFTQILALRSIIFTSNFSKKDNM